MNHYPLDEGIEFKFVCVGCGSRHVTTVPRHSAPFLWRCQTEGCGWTLTVQTDPAGVSAGFTAPIKKKFELHLVRGED
jgi:hypothetical protein